MNSFVGPPAETSAAVHLGIDIGAVCVERDRPKVAENDVESHTKHALTAYLKKKVPYTLA